MTPIFEIGNYIIKLTFFIILNKNKVRIIITFFNKINLCLYFNNKCYSSFEKIISEKTSYSKYNNKTDIFIPFKPKYTEYKDNKNKKLDIKTIAWYLPQFHEFEENNKWWGNGFTEWTNVKKALPLYKGHYQPRIPHQDIGYYNLDNIDIIRKQVSIAKNYGIYGFCFYHYDFNGKRLMEKPVNNFILHKDIDFNFCLSYANENWTRAWDGDINNILIENKYSKKYDMKFIENLQKYFDDDRYIKINGKPMLLVYRPLLFPDIKSTTDTWRNYQIKKTGKDLFLVFTRSIARPLDKASVYGFDMYVDFNIHNALYTKSVSTGIYNTKSYETFVKDIINDNILDIRFKELFLLWDNSPRKSKDFFIMENFNFDLYREWLKYNIKFTRTNFKEDMRFMFINAWNEWGEGSYLEPDKQNGYTFLDILYQELTSES